MEHNELAHKTLEILMKTAKEAAALDSESIDYRVVVEELSDCTFLLAGDFGPEEVEKVKSSTTCEALYDLLAGENTVAAEKGQTSGNMSTLES